MIWSFCWYFWLIFIPVVFLKADFNYSSSFVLSWVDKVTNGTLSFVSVIENVAWADTLVATAMQFLDDFRSRLISKLIKGISRVLQNYLDTSMIPLFQHFFVSSMPVWPVIFSFYFKWISKSIIFIKISKCIFIS